MSIDAILLQPAFLHQEALARDKPGMYQHQREVENNISITMQSYTHVGWRHNGPGVTGAPL